MQACLARPLALPAVAWAILLLAVGWPARGEEERYPTLKVGTDTYTNVVVLNKTRTDVFLKHAHGMANIKVRDMDPDTQERLGYEVERPKPNKMEQVFQTPPALVTLEAHPEVQAVEEQLAAQSEVYLERLDERAAIAVVAGVILVYLIFCYLCRCICVKTSNPPSPLIWLPLFKQIPLFKAAGMSPWWILTNFLGPVFLIAYAVWSFKITRARAKNAFWGVMLLLPVANLFAFLYLALSGDGSEQKETGSFKISLAPAAPRRDAA